MVEYPYGGIQLCLLMLNVSSVREDFFFPMFRMECPTHTSICLSAWSRFGLVKDHDVMEVVRLPEVNGTECSDSVDDNM